MCPPALCNLLRTSAHLLIPFYYSQHHKLRSSSLSQREVQAFSKGEEFGALMIPQGGSGTKLSGTCSSRFEGDVTADDFSAATQGPFRRQHKRFLCLVIEKLIFFSFAP